MSKIVNLEYLESYDINLVQQAVESSFLKLDLEQSFKNIKKVLLKVCLPYAASQDMAETTHPSVVRAVVNVLSNYGIKCVVADSSYGNYSISNLDKVYLNTGMLEVANQTNCELNHNLKTCKVEVVNGVATKSLTIIDVVNDVDAIINIGKLKINSNLGFCGATSNLFGLLPGEFKTLTLNRLLTLKDFYNFNLDIYQAIENKLIINIVDAIVAMEAGNSPRMLYCLAVGENALALDGALLNILNIDYSKTILNQAQNRNLIDLDKPFKLVGEKIEKFTLQDFVLTEFSEKSNIHNSESERKKYFKNTQKRVVINGKKCKGCGICSKICPTKALNMKYDKNGELYATIDYNKCIFCYKCITACPYKVADTVEPLGYKKLNAEIDKHNEV